MLAAVAIASAHQQYPVTDAIAQKVIQKYQGSTCEQLVADKQKPPDPKQAQTMEKAMKQLRSDPEMRKAFIDKVAAPIVNKMFECGMIP